MLHLHQILIFPIYSFMFVVLARGWSSWVVVLLTACRCNPFGTIRDDCDQMTGRCVCRSHVTGNKCDVCSDGVTAVLSREDCSSNSSRRNDSIISASSTATGPESGMINSNDIKTDYIKRAIGHAV